MTLATLLCYFSTARTGVVFGTVSSVGSARGAVSRWNCAGACNGCGAKTSLLGSLHTARCSSGAGIVPPGRAVEVVVTVDGRSFLYDNGSVFVPCRGCAALRRATRVAGKVDLSKSCNARCEAACGPSCECACGGKNHGASVSL